jgi:hypothetical protein
MPKGLPGAIHPRSGRMAPVVIRPGQHQELPACRGRVRGLDTRHSKPKDPWVVSSSGALDRAARAVVAPMRNVSLASCGRRNPMPPGGTRESRRRRGRGLVQGAVRPAGAAEALLFPRHGHQAALVPCHGPAGQSASAAADPASHDRVPSRAPGRRSGRSRCPRRGRPHRTRRCSGHPGHEPGTLPASRCSPGPRAGSRPTARSTPGRDAPPRPGSGRGRRRARSRHGRAPRRR